ncbi:MAG: succinate dehydrogenase flavoprotein subunit [Thiotrichales bacterium]
MSNGIARRKFDALIIGAGGAGLRAALQLAQAEASVAVMSKVFPTRSHTVAAQGGVNAALANVSPDNWHWHMFDTVKGSDYLGDQDAIEFMCQAAPRIVYELEHSGVPFSRLDNGNIYQRAFGGQSQNFGGAQAARTCAAADRTGHAILHALYQQNIRARTHFFDEYFAVDLLQDEEGHVLGVLAFEILSGEPIIIEAKNTLLATGGVGQIFRTNSNALINSGDGMGMALRAGIPLQDMEFFQFHPTGIAGRGMLITEGCRGEGGFLVNGEGERFMERYAPNAKDLASRDVVSRAIAVEVREGRGCGPNKDHVFLQLHHLGAEVIKKRLPGIRETSITFVGVDPVERPIPVYPTAHYTMGGIPTDRQARVVAPHKNNPEEVVPGLYAAGECACVSVHGANRLGGNSLLDILVFGKAAAESMLQALAENPYHRPLPDSAIERPLSRMAQWDTPGKGESVDELRAELKKVMEIHCGVYREEAVMAEGLEQVKRIAARYRDARVQDQSKVFNTTRVEAMELDNLIGCALATAASALARQESRGAHSRVDFPERDDVNWMKHSLYSLQTDTVDFKPVRTKPLTVESFPPKKRVY